MATCWVDHVDKFSCGFSLELRWTWVAAFGASTRFCFTLTGSRHWLSSPPFLSTSPWSCSHRLKAGPGCPSAWLISSRVSQHGTFGLHPIGVYLLGSAKTSTCHRLMFSSGDSILPSLPKRPARWSATSGPDPLPLPRSLLTRLPLLQPLPP